MTILGTRTAKHCVACAGVSVMAVATDASNGWLGAPLLPWEPFTRVSVTLMLYRAADAANSGARWAGAELGHVAAVDGVRIASESGVERCVRAVEKDTMANMAMTARAAACQSARAASGTSQRREA
jgi:hypothetical protein